MVSGNSRLGVAAFLKQWQDRFNHNDFDGLAILYADAASLHGTSSGMLHEGRAAIRSYFAGESTVTFGEMSVSSPVSSLHIAVGFYEFELKGNSAGEGRSLRARFSFLIREEGEGCHILHHHSSLCP